MRFHFIFCFLGIVILSLIRFQDYKFFFPFYFNYLMIVLYINVYTYLNLKALQRENYMYLL